MTPTNRDDLTRAKQPDFAVPPGETLRDLLEGLAMSQAELARRTSLSTKHVHLLLKGAVSLSADVARRLEFVTGTSAGWWLRLEADYQAALVRLGEPTVGDTELAWVKSMPVQALVKMGALPAEPSGPAARLVQLLRFFGVASTEAYSKLWSEPLVSFRQSAAYDVDSGAVASWLRLGELAASESAPTSAFDPDGLQSNVRDLVHLTREPIRQGFAAFVEACAGWGVTVVAVPEVPGARAFGATRWTANGRRPLIQLSLRGKTDDTLWLTAFHELAHVLRHDRRTVFVESEEPATNSPVQAEEADADRFAWDTLLPAVYSKRLDDVRSVADACDLAEDAGIANSLIVRRMYRDAKWDYKVGSHLRRPVNIDDVVAGRDTSSAPTSDQRSSRRLGRRLPGADRE